MIGRNITLIQNSLKTMQKRRKKPLINSMMTLLKHLIQVISLRQFKRLMRNPQREFTKVIKTRLKALMERQPIHNSIRIYMQRHKN
jgi:hypothetical protein